MAALRHNDCKVLASELEKIKFEKGGAREQELTYQHVNSFIRTALELGNKGAMSRDRALYMAIGVASQFELMLRQKDIIGAWEPARADRRFPSGVAIVRLDEQAETWSGFCTWENIPGWRWRKIKIPRAGRIRSHTLRPIVPIAGGSASRSAPWPDRQGRRWPTHPLPLLCEVV